MSLFLGLEIGRRAIQTQELALSITANNIANANTEGYSRQIPLIEQADSTIIPLSSSKSGQVPIGTGAQISEVNRTRDKYLDEGIRDLTSEYSRFDMERKQLEEVEGVFNEPSENGLSAKLDTFWDAWVNLYSLDPFNTGSRSEVREASIVLADTFNSYYNQLNTMREDIDDKIADRITKVNDLASELASINKKIAGQNLLGNPNDILDQRDKLLEDMSQYANVEIVLNPNETVNVSIGGTLIVASNSVFEMASRVDQDGRLPIWASSNAEVNITSGEFKGLMDVRDDYIKPYIEKLNAMATNLRLRINEQHTQGYDQDGLAGQSFFVGTDASNIALNTAISGDVSKIAASETSLNAHGNGKNAEAIANVRDELLMNTGSQSIDDYYVELLTNLGSRSGETESLRENQNILMTQLKNRRNSVSGVSIDEEMTDVLKYQSSYQAAAKFINVINGLTEAVINLL